jgi:hypothetical protein
VVAEAEASGAWVVSVPTAAIVAGIPKMVAYCSMMAIKRRVWERLGKGPWFKWVHDEKSETLLSPATVGEDAFFLKLCAENDIKVRTHGKAAGHWKTVDITGGAR